MQTVKAELDKKTDEARSEIADQTEKAKKEMDGMVADISDMIVNRIMLSA